MANKSGIHIKESKKGSLHKALGVAKGDKIPASKLKIKSSDSPSLRKKKQFALNAKKFKHQTGGSALPQIENTNPGMNPIQAPMPTNPTFDPMNNMNPYPEPMDQMMPGGPHQQQQGRYKIPVMRESPYTKSINTVASIATGIGDTIQNGRQNREDRFKLIEGMTPRYMQNMQGKGLNDNPAYTMYGGPSDMATFYTGNMHGEGTTTGIINKSVGPNFRQYSKGVESDVSDRRTEADVPVAGKPGKMPRTYMMGGPAKGALGWDYDDHIMYMMYGGADYGVPSSYSDMDNEDFGLTGIAHNGPYGQNSVYRVGGNVSSDKAKEILRDGTVHGHDLTDKQKRYFGWLAGGGKKQYGGWDQEGFMMQAGGPVQQQSQPAPQQQPQPQPQQSGDGLSPEAYYQSSATLAYYKGKLNDQLKSKNPQAFGEYFKGLQQARGSGKPQDAQSYIQGSQYNDYLTPDEVKKALGTDKDYQNYLNSIKQVNSYNVKQGQQPLYGTEEGQNDPSKLNYGRRFASLQVTPSFGKTLQSSSGDKHYNRNYQYNPQTGQVDFTEIGDTSLRPQGFAPPPQQNQGDGSVSKRRYGGRKYQTGGGQSFMTGPAMQNGGQGFAIGDEIEMSLEQIKAMKKQGYKFEEL